MPPKDLQPNKNIINKTQTAFHLNGKVIKNF